MDGNNAGGGDGGGQPTTTARLLAYIRRSYVQTVGYGATHAIANPAAYSCRAQDTLYEPARLDSEVKLTRR
jgi:hypothetical protein